MHRRRYIKAVECCLCGKILLDTDEVKSLHFRIAHGINTYERYYKPSPYAEKLDTPVNILNSYKEKRKFDFLKYKKKKKIEHKSIYWGRVITSGFETKR